MTLWHQYEPSVEVGDFIEYNCLGVKDSGIVQELQWFMNRWEVIFESNKGNGEICAPDHNCEVISRGQRDVRQRDSSIYQTEIR